MIATTIMISTSVKPDFLFIAFPPVLGLRAATLPVVSIDRRHNQQASCQHAILSNLNVILSYDTTNMAFLWMRLVKEGDCARETDLNIANMQQRECHYQKRKGTFLYMTRNKNVRAWA